MKIHEEKSNLIGLHWFTAYQGDIVKDILGNILNPIVYVSPIIKNIIVTNGKNLAMNRLFGLGAAVALTSVGVGTDVTAAALGQAQLNPSVVGTVLIQTADAGTALVGQTVTMTSTFGTAVANFTWNEAGLFNGNVNGTSTLFNRTIIGPFTKTSAVSIVYSVSVTQS